MYVFIKEMENENELINNLNIPTWLKNMNLIYRKRFNIVTIDKIDDLHYLYIIPKIKNVKILKRIINKNEKNSIILSKKLGKYNKELGLKSKKITKYFIYNILKYIEQKTQIKIEMKNIYFLANNYNEENLNIIKYILNKVKTVTIVTSSVKNFSIIEDKIFNTDGILISVTNNKKTALKKADIIINLDFLNEDIIKYRINNKSIIINCINEKIDIVYFQGIIINNIEIDFEKDNKYKILYEDFNKNDIYTSTKISNEKYTNIVNNIQKEKVKIKYLIGNNGKIDKREFAKNLNDKS